MASRPAARIASRRNTAALTMPRTMPFSEQGVVGTVVYAGGYIQHREKSAKWMGAQKYITIADMAVNTSIIAAGVRYTSGLVAHPRWTIKPSIEGDAEAEAAAELVESAIHDMSTPWSHVVRRAYMYKFYGFGLQEWTAKRRPDGKVGLASIAPRPQFTVDRWEVDDAGIVAGVWQMSPKTGASIGIPRSKLLYLVDSALSDSPEGVGVFRHLAEPWERLKMFHDLEARAFERDLRGIPIGRIPYTLINEAVKAGQLTEAKAKDMVKSMEDFVQIAVKQSDTGLTIDSAPYVSQAADGDKVTGTMQWGLELLQGAGGGMVEIASSIKRTQFEMATVMCVQQLLFGMEGQSGNRAMSKDMSQNLYLMANAALTDISSGVDMDIIGPICLLNNIPEEKRPWCEVEDVAFKDAESVASTLAKMAQAGAVLSPDDPVIADVRELMGVSEPSPVSPEMLGMVGDSVDEEDDAEVEAVADDIEEEAEGEDGEVAKVAPKTFYVNRPLLNADAVRKWAASQGIATTLRPDDMHVTVAFSKAELDWSLITPDPNRMTVLGGKREVHQFLARTTPNGALVLKFESAQLRKRWQVFKDAGASWEFPEYQPHITLTYSVPEADVGALTAYAGPLIFGPEEFSELNENWANEIAEIPTGAE